MANVKVLHPSERLLSEITKRGMKQKELAIRTGVSEKHISTILNGTKSISVSFGRKLDIALGNEIGTWAGRQAEYDNYMACMEDENRITAEEINILKSLKDIYAYLVDLHVMHNNCGDPEKILQLRQFLRVNSLEVIPKITYNAAYRAQVNTSTNIDQYVLFTWQRMCEFLTENVELKSSFDKDMLKNSIPRIKREMFTEDANHMVRNLKGILAECGVAFDVVKHFRGAPVQGFIKESNKGRVILCVTIRGKAADRFWFSLFHEIGHLLNGDLETRFVDFDSVKSDMEDKADIFARDTLIAPDLYRKLIISQSYFDLRDIKRFARAIGVPHWIVIGRLHSDEWLDWSILAHETPAFEWAE